MNLKRMILKIFAVLIVGSFSLAGACQDIHFSQFFETPLLRNPSLAGIFTGDIRVQAVYRDQWNSVTNAYRTGSLNAEYKMPIGKSEDFVTVGMQLLYDRAGTIGWTSTHILPALNYHKSLSASRNRYLSLGFMGGLVQRRFDRSKITTNTQYNGGGDGETLTNSQFSYLDGSVGLSYNSDINDNPGNNFFLGAAYHHFNRPRNAFYTNANVLVTPKWVFSGGIRFGVTDYSFLTIQADQSMQGSFNETVAGVMYALKLGQNPDQPDYTVHGGALLRWNDALIPVIQLDYSPFSVAVSYDVNISKLKPSSYGRGGFELSISYIGFVNRASSSVNFTHCPRF
jgi:type IX secretion system PorP/SprF family membrane protein